MQWNKSDRLFHAVRDVVHYCIRVRYALIDVGAPNIVLGSAIRLPITLRKK